MRRTGFKPQGSKRTVSLTINSDLYAQAKKLGVNASRVAEEALANEVARRRAEALAAEIRADLDAANAYTEKHGSFAELVREHYASLGDETV